MPQRLLEGGNSLGRTNFSKVVDWFPVHDGAAGTISVAGLVRTGSVIAPGERKDLSRCNPSLLGQMDIDRLPIIQDFQLKK